MNIKKNITLALILFGGLVYSCSGDENIEVEPKGGEDGFNGVYLSMDFNSNNQPELREGGDPDTDAESRIYSLEVLIFKPGGELDGYASRPRKEKTPAPTGKNYDKEFDTRDTIANIKLTAGTRDIYVIANAPDNSFAAVTTLAKFKEKYESLSTQGYGLVKAHPNGTTVKDQGGNPIGGVEPDGLHTNLTMCSYATGVVFSKSHKRHYMGFASVPSGGYNLGSNPFEVERLVARVLLSKVSFAIPGSLVLDGETITKDNYSYALDSVFMINAKMRSPFPDNGNKVTKNFGYGCDANTYNTTTYWAGVQRSAVADNTYSSELFEEIYTPDYDWKGSNSSPIWFYTFENDASEFPTYMVIGVRFNFKKSNGDLKTIKYYYPVIINRNGISQGKADHNYIKRNHQYLLSVNIKGIGNANKGELGPLKSSSDELDDSVIEVEEVVGRNLFPWTGNKIK